MFETTPGTQCPNCGQFKIEYRSGVKNILKVMFACGILIITLPLELILIPALIVAACMPSQRKNFRFCRNCKWNERASEAVHAPAA